MNPLYYVTFTTFTLIASFILFQGFNTTDAVNTISLLCGFLTIFTGVYLLNLSREDPDGRGMMGGPSEYDVDGIPTDGMAASLTRRSMQARRSSDAHRRSGSLNLYSPTFSNNRTSGDADRQGLMHNYDLESQNGDKFGLADLAEDDDDENEEQGRKSFGQKIPNGGVGGVGAAAVNGKIQVERVRPTKTR